MTSVDLDVAPTGGIVRVPLQRTLIGSIAASTAVILPVLMVSGLAVLMQRDIGFSDAELGLAVAAFFTTAAAAGPIAGRISVSIGPTRTSFVGLLTTTVCLLGVASTTTYTSLVAFLLIGGLGNGAVQLGVNVILASAVRREHHGLAFGLKQASIPFASLLAGLALPFLGLSVGWRWAFVAACVVLPVAALMLPRQRQSRSPRCREDLPDASLASLLTLATGVALGAAASTGATTFLVTSSIWAGLEEAEAGTLLAVASVAAAAVRVATGLAADRLPPDSLRLLAGLLILGGAGYLGMALGSQGPFAIAALLAFGAGWGWAGLVALSVARSSPSSTATAMGIVQTGPQTGSVLGPLVFGVVAGTAGYTWAWMGTAGLAGVAACLVLAARRLMRPLSSPNGI